MFSSNGRQESNVSFKEPKDIKGYYYDPQLKSHFKIPKPGDVGYARYKEIIKLREVSKQEDYRQVKPIPNRFKNILRSELLTLTQDIRNVSHLLRSNSHINGQLEQEEDLSDGLIHEFSYNPTNQILLFSNKFLNACRLSQDYKFEIRSCCTSKVSEIVWLEESLNQFRFSTSFIGNEHTPGYVEMFSMEDNSFSMNEYSFSSTTYFKLLTGTLWTHAWSPDLEKLIVGCQNGFKVISRRQIKTFRGKSSILSLCYPDMNRVYLGARDGTITLWDSRISYKKSPSVSHKYPITQIKELKDNNYFISSSSDGTIHVWDERLLKPVSTTRFSNDFKKYRFDTDHSEEYLYYGGGDKYIYVYSLKTNALITRWGPFDNDIKILQSTEDKISRKSIPGIMIADGEKLKIYSLS